MKLKAALRNMCITFTILTVFSSIYSLLNGIAIDKHFYTFARFIFCLIGFGSFILYGKLKKYLLNQYLAGGVHYLLTISLAFIFVWSTSFFITLTPSAYRDLFINATIIYVIVSFLLWFKTEYII